MEASYDEVENYGSRLELQMVQDAVLAEMAEYERRAEEFGFEPYGTAAEEVASYDRHRRSHLEQIRASRAELAALIAQVKRRRDGRIALVAAGCLIACALLWVAALHWRWPL